MPAVFRLEDRPSDPFGATTPCEARAWIGSPRATVAVTSISRHGNNLHRPSPIDFTKNTLLHKRFIDRTSTRPRGAPSSPSPTLPRSSCSSPARGPREVVPHDVDATTPREPPQVPPQRRFARARAPATASATSRLRGGGFFGRCCGSKFSTSGDRSTGATRLPAMPIATGGGFGARRCGGRIMTILLWCLGAAPGRISVRSRAIAAPGLRRWCVWRCLVH